MSRCSFITLSLLLIAYYYWSYQFFLAQPEPNNAAIPLQVANQHHGSVEDSVKRELQLGQDGDAVKNAGAPRPDDRWEVDDNEPAAGQNRAGPDVPEDEDDDDRAALKDEDDDLEDDEKKPSPKKKKKPKKMKNKKKKQKHHEEEKPVEEAEEKPSDDEGDKPANKEDQQPNDDVPNNADEEPPMPNSKEKLEVKEGNAVARGPQANIEKQKDSAQQPEKEEDENAGDDKADKQENEEDQHPNDQAPNDGDNEPPKPVAKGKLEVKEGIVEARVPEVGIEKQKDAVQKPAQQEAENTRGDGADPEDKRPNNHAPGKDPPKPEAKDKLEVKENKAVAKASVAEVKKQKDAVQSNLRHMAVVSVTYFEKSQSYPPNTMVVVFTAAKKQNLTLHCWSSNGTHVTKPASVRQITKKDYVPKCRWNTHIATCQTATNPTEFGLITSNGSDVAKMPYREAVKQHYGVVGCFSPMFYSDRWQVLIALMDVYRQLGMDLQVFYVMSILKQIADYMK
ncbi:Protein F59C6.8, partial [Aphelenchoides avenae]